MNEARRRRRLRRARKAARGIFCESQMWSQSRWGERCPYFATGYQRQNDIYVCGHHARAYLHVERITKEISHG